MEDEERMFLIVDDEPDMCWALENLLRRCGFISKLARSGQQALRLIESNRFRLAFVDAKLPDIEGLTLARQMHTFDPSVKIVIISGYFYKDDVSIQSVLREGLICGFISKPFDHDEILKIIQNK
jgi:DNA-binding NtrC family response regulator